MSLPTRESFRALADPDGDQPVVVRAEADLDVAAEPLAAYAALADGPYSFLLESAEKTAGSDPDGAFRAGDAAGDRHARFSFVGYDPDAVVRVEPDGRDVERLRDSTAAERVAADDPATCDGSDDGGDCLDALRASLPDADLANFPDTDRQLLDGGLVGFLAYDAVYDLWLDEVGVERPETPLPDAEFVLTTRTLVFDHADDAVSLVLTPLLDGDDPDAVYDALRDEVERVETALADADPPATGGFRQEREEAGLRDDYEAAVRETRERVLDGEIYQGVVSRTRRRYGDIDPLGLYESLRDVNPSPYMYVLDHGERAVVGASPETLVSVAGDEVLVNPIAGTCPRGSSPVEDRRLAGEMLADEKERAEHTMLVDLARNDVRRVSEPGSVQVPEFMGVLKYSHVQHIESTVTGRLAADADVFDAVRATFPAGTLSGAPKIRAMEIIDELETRPRGVYGGGVGYVSWTGDADFAIVIRTATVRRGDGAAAPSVPSRQSPDAGAPDEVTVRAGAGIVADSDPAAEYDETESKMGGVLAALDAIRDERPADQPAEVSR